MLYFAFGSNLLTQRLKRRCPSAEVVARAIAPGYRVAFEKLSEDTSGKATLVRCADADSAAGVVYELTREDTGALDAFEGPGYRRLDDFSVHCLDTGMALSACTYIARQHVADLKPYDWYLALVLAGLAEHDIGHEFARQLQITDFDTDTQCSRQSRQNALRDLASAGYSDYREILNSKL
jgi:hypothetical protein